MKKVRQYIGECGHRIWFDNIVGCSQLFCLGNIFLVGGSGINDYGYIAKGTQFFNFGKALPAVHAGHVQIEKI